MMQPSDEAIMSAVRRGELDQLEVLYRRHREPLFGFFSRITGNRVVSEDLVHEVFLRILKYRRSYRPESRFVSWMYQISRNVRTDYQRKYSIASAEDYPQHSPAHEGNTPSRLLEESEQIDLLQCALRRMSESNRELLILARYQEMKYEDIAEVYGIPVQAVKMRVYRATNELRATFVDLRSKRFPCNAMKSKTTLPTT